MDQISEFMNYLEADNSISASTRSAYKSDISRFFEYLNKRSKSQSNFTNIEKKSFSKFLDQEKKLGLKPSTLHRRRAALKKFAEYLSRQGKADIDTIVEITNWQQDLWEKIARREAEYLLDEEINQLFEAIDVEEKPRNIRDKAIVSLILETGMSIGSIVCLDLQDLNLRLNLVRLPGYEDNWCPLENSSKHLKTYLKESRPELTQSVNEAALFVSQMGSRITRQGVWQVIHAWGEASSLEVQLSPRILRHTALLKMIKSGLSVEEIQHRLGHANVLSTQALIRKISKSEKQRRID